MIAFLLFLSAITGFYLPPSDTTHFLLVPLDHHVKNARKIEISYMLMHAYDKQKETILLIEDPLDKYFQESIDLQPLRDEFNIVHIKGRNEADAILKIINSSGEIDWAKAYQLLNMDQQARDIELVRKDLPGDRPVHLFGYSGAAAYSHYYLGLFPENVKSLISFNPLLFDLQKNLNLINPSQCLESIPLENTSYLDFLWYNNSENLCKEQTGTEDIDLAFYTYLKWRFLLPSLVEADKADIALKIRLFEHSYGLTYNAAANLLESKIAKWMMLESHEIWKQFERIPFSVYGVNYDRGLNFTGKVLIVGAVHDKLLPRFCYDVLAEFYLNSTLLLIRDGHSFGKLGGSMLHNNLIRSFINNDIKEKVSVYQLLQEKGLLYNKKDRVRY
ncbi:alpha/beta hydrolase [Cyclobacterium sp. 1_MG-2023]|uniref:alpha/beta fold hydrolase n=1 Tax=Cyclobacterium sp. 1_MG-2023 TaxID=3062681 RepID=UPI0026E3F3F1|nr:alpha/beta hydrolase [Cyclobacterium sp. 1_MG-2023]MDO6440191.1 alpha/beta hydrolase [Cyclobacterium sp. 1_MG-2023]